MICDVGCFLGAWPFRSLPSSGPRGLKAMARKQGVTCVAVSAFEEVFHEDAFRATARLTGRLASLPMARQFQVVNPLFPGWQRDLERGVRELGIRGVRLTPGYHGYALTDPAVQALADAAREFQLPVAIHARLQDERMHWISRFPPVPVKEAGEFLAKTPGLRVALLGFEVGEAGSISAIIKDRPAAWVDWSRLRCMLWGLDRLLEQIPAERILYGSLWPLQTPSAMLNLAKVARIGEAARKRILWTNGIRFLTGRGR